MKIFILLLIHFFQSMLTKKKSIQSHLKVKLLIIHMSESGG